MMTWILTKCQTMKKDIWKEAIVGHAQSLHRVLPTFLKWASELVKGSPSHAAVLYYVNLMKRHAIEFACSDSGTIVARNGKYR